MKALQFVTGVGAVLSLAGAVVAMATLHRSKNERLETIPTFTVDQGMCVLMRGVNAGQQDLQNDFHADPLYRSNAQFRADVLKADRTVKCAAAGVEAYCAGKDAPPCS